MRLQTMLRQTVSSTAASARIFGGDVGRGLLEVGHNTLALVGLAAIGVVIFAFGREEIRHQVEVIAFEWLQTRHGQREEAVDMAAAAGPALSTTGVVAGATPPSSAAEAKAPATTLTRQQASLASWIARRYKVAPEPIGALVQEAWAIGHRASLDPTLILAIMAIESRFNPFAQSPVGAQGLMQVMTRVHDDKYRSFGGTRAAFDPISNLRVGVLVLKECIARAGSLQEGLRHYVGAALIEGDGGYVGKVLAEHAHMRGVADGMSVPVNTPTVKPAPPAKPESIVNEPAPVAEPATEPQAAPEQVALLN